MRRLSLALVVLLLAVSGVRGDSPDSRLSRDTIIENDRYFSPNGRFCLVMRQFVNIPDFGGRRADRVVRFAAKEATIPAGPEWVLTHRNRGHYASGPAFPAGTAALYDRRRHIAEINLGFQWRGGQARVSDSGRYVVLLLNGPWNNLRSPIVWIYRSNDAVGRSLFEEEIFLPGDFLPRSNHRLLIPSIQENDEAGRDVLLLTSPALSGTIRIDLATGSRLPSPR